jgi:ribonuclease VapC
VEATIVEEARLGAQGVVNLQRILAAASIRTIPFDPTDADAAIEAWRRYGRGKRPAGLNLGDCYSYAAAIRRQAPLLFVGDEFSQTDVDVA